MIIDEDDLVCPITQYIMRDPVMTSNGETYERDAIEEWLKHNKTSPLTREPILSVVYPSKFFAKKINELEKAKPFMYMERYQYNIIGFLKYICLKYTLVCNDSKYIYMFNDFKNRKDINTKSNDVLFESVHGCKNYIHCGK